MNRMAAGVFLVFALLGVTGCDSVQMVYSRNHPPFETKGGLIRYWIDENVRQNQSRRDEAYRKIHEFCNGPYRIAKEDNVYAQEEGTYLLNTYSHRETSKESGYWYVDFKCLSNP